MAGMLLLLGACAHQGNFPQTKVNPDRDPLQPMNKAFFSFNNTFDTLLFKPAAGLYRGIFPSQIRDRFDSFFHNLREPNNFANALLKGDFSSAGRVLGRFVVNTTIGVGGLYDVGEKHMDMPYQRHDFGQTLTSWGVQNGPYLMLPILGPSNFRDGVGQVVDFFMDPFTIVLLATNHSTSWTLARDVPEAIHDRSRLIEPIDNLKKTSLDFYAAVRSAYFQNRHGWATGAKGKSGSQAYDDLWKEDHESAPSLPEVAHSSKAKSYHKAGSNAFPTHGTLGAHEQSHHMRKYDPILKR